MASPMVGCVHGWVWMAVDDVEGGSVSKTMAEGHAEGAPSVDVPDGGRRVVVAVEFADGSIYVGGAGVKSQEEIERLVAEAGRLCGAEPGDGCQEYATVTVDGENN